MDAPYTLAIVFHLAQLPAGGYLPEAKRAVPTTGECKSSIAAQTDGMRQARVAFEYANTTAGKDVPKAKEGVPTS